MRKRDIFLLAYSNIKYGGVKVVLCIIAVLTGVLSFCIAKHGGEYAKDVIKNELDTLGIRGIAVYSKSDVSLTEDDYSEIRNVEGVEYAVPLSVMNGKLRYRQNVSSALIIGTTDEIASVWSLKIKYGKFFDQEQMLYKEPCAVIDSDLAYEMYKRENVVGKTVSLSGDDGYTSFKIIGVVNSQKRSLQSIIGADVPAIIYVPCSTITGADFAAVSCLNDFDVDSVSSKITDVLRERNGVAFSYKNLDVYMSSFKKIIGIVALLASGFAVVALIAGGIGVMSNMLSAAESRHYEIGVIISLGATKKDILKIYLIESVLICLIGGLIGWALGECILDYISFKYDIAFQSGVSVAIAGIGVSLICGVVFGVIPAIYASSIKPINALKR